MALPTDLIEDVIGVAGHDLVVLRPRDADTQRDEPVPYWADLWPSAIALARTLAGRALRGARVLELGCGLGLPSLAAALAGGRVLATDRSPDAIDVVRRNAEYNGLSLEALAADWCRPSELLARGPFDLVIAADVLYEQRNCAPLAELLSALDSETWLADPGRPPAAQLVSDLQLAGWNASTLAVTERPRVTVHRLEPGRMY